MEQYGGSVERVTETVTAGSTTTLVNTSTQLQVFTGTANQTVILPVATTYTKPGGKFEIYNMSTGTISVKYQDSTALQTVVANSTLIVKLVTNGTANGTWTTLNNSTLSALNAPTVQKFTSSSGTYTTPVSPAPLYIRVRAIGGGGGGTGGNNSATATSGGITTFGTSLITANGGVGANGPNGGAGGSCTVNSPAITVINVSGGYGASGNEATTGVAPSGGSGGNSYMGGAGNGGEPGSGSNNGTAGATNSGSGGGGGSQQSSSTSGAGGGSGGYCEAIISAPSATYSYSVGGGGAGTSGGSNGANGATGGSGYIVVEEFYQ